MTQRMPTDSLQRRKY